VTILVLLPGMDGSGALFAGLAAALGGDVTAQIVSYPAGQPLDYAGLIGFARACLPADRPYYLLGESFSGPVAIALAAERPPMLAGLILSCTFARNPAPLMRVLRPLVRFAPLYAALTPLAAPLLLGWRSTRLQRQGLYAALRSTRPAILRARTRAVLDADFTEQARKVAVPVLYLQAQQDWVVPDAAGRCLQTLLPAMTIAVLSGPHLLLQSAPHEAAARIRAFMGV
jgi:pimeloyl-[acyl-carrier protein] methyl ester esterase